MNIPPNPLTALAERVEQLTGPCRETDAEIWMTLHPDWRDYPRNELGGWDCPTGRTRAAEPYTESLDAAMTLARNNREAMLMVHAAFGSFESDEMDAAPNIFPRIKSMLLTNLRARAASESPHG